MSSNEGGDIKECYFKTAPTQKEFNTHDVKTRRVRKATDLAQCSAVGPGRRAQWVPAVVSPEHVSSTMQKANYN